MGFIDWFMTGGDWEEMKRIKLYKQLGKKLDEMTAEEIDEQIKLLEEAKKKKK